MFWHSSGNNQIITFVLHDAYWAMFNISTKFQFSSTQFSFRLRLVFCHVFYAIRFGSVSFSRSFCLCPYPMLSNRRRKYILWTRICFAIVRNLSGAFVYLRNCKHIVIWIQFFLHFSNCLFRLFFFRILFTNSMCDDQISHFASLLTFSQPQS